MDPWYADTEEVSTMVLISTKQVQEQTSLSRTTVWRLESKGLFPSRIQVSPGRVAWSEEEVNAWLESRQRVNGEGGNV